MKLEPLISFILLLFVIFPLSNADEKVLDARGNPVFTGRLYSISQTSMKDGGGFTVGLTGNSKCPVTVLQWLPPGLPSSSVKFTIAGRPRSSSDEIYTGNLLEIEFIEKPNCAESSKWMVFEDKAMEKRCVGIGGPQDHPGQQISKGYFAIEKYKDGYKLVFCETGSDTCLNIAGYDNGELGRRLIPTQDDEPFNLIFSEVAPKSVV